MQDTEADIRILEAMLAIDHKTLDDKMADFIAVGIALPGANKEMTTLTSTGILQLIVRWMEAQQQANMDRDETITDGLNIAAVFRLFAMTSIGLLASCVTPNAAREAADKARELMIMSIEDFSDMALPLGRLFTDLRATNVRDELRAAITARVAAYRTKFPKTHQEPTT